MGTKGRVFVTGGTGFIGRHLLDLLCRSGYVVAALLRDGLAVPQVSSPIQWVYRSRLRGEFRAFKPTAVIHLATNYGFPGTAASDVIDVNLQLPIELVELAIEHLCPLFLNTDSFYGKTGFRYGRLPLYVKSKSSFLTMANCIEGTHSHLRLVNMRLEHVYGPGDRPEKFTSYLMKMLSQGMPIPLTRGEQQRDFIYVSDVVCAYDTVLQNYEQLPMGPTEIEVGVGESVSIREFVKSLSDGLGSKSHLQFGSIPTREDEILRSVADNAALRNLGWTPKVGLLEGIRSMLRGDGYGSSESLLPQ